MNNTATLYEIAQDALSQIFLYQDKAISEWDEMNAVDACHDLMKIINNIKKGANADLFYLDLDGFDFAITDLCDIDITSDGLLYIETTNGNREMPERYEDWTRDIDVYLRAYDDTDCMDEIGFSYLLRSEEECEEYRDECAWGDRIDELVNEYLSR